jgi:hypothetical protein
MHVPEQGRGKVFVYAYKVMKCFLEMILQNKYDNLLCNPIYYQYAGGGDVLLCFSSFSLIKEIRNNPPSTYCKAVADEIYAQKAIINKVVDIAVKQLMKGRIMGIIGGVLLEVPPDIERGLKFAGTTIIRKTYKTYSKLRVDRVTAEKFYKALKALEETYMKT